MAEPAIITPGADDAEDASLSHSDALKVVAKLRAENAKRRANDAPIEPDVVNENRVLKERLEKIDADKRAADEVESLKRGEHEKVIAEKEAELLSERRVAKEKERTLRDRLMERELKVHLADSIDADVCAKLIDKKMISFDPETYEISGVDAAVALLREAKPHFFGAAKPTGTNVAGRGATPGGSKVSSNLMDQEGTLDSLVGQYR